MAIPTMSNNTPQAGHIAWGAFTIQYNGVGYAIGAGSTAARWVWWRFNGGTSVIEAGADIPTDLTDDDLVLFGNKNGIGIRVQSTSLIDGELLVDGSIFAQAIAANQLTTDHIVTSGLDASVIKFGTMSGERIEANTISTLQLAAGAVTALELSAEAVTAEKIAAGAITAESIASGDIMATLALLGSLLVGEEEGRHIVMHPQVGLMLVDAQGNPLVHFPLSPTERNRFTGDVVTDGFTALGNAQFRGFNNEISINSEFKLASGLTRPSNVPTINTSYREPITGIPMADNDVYNETTPYDDTVFRGSNKFHYDPATDSLETTTTGGGTGFWAGKQHQIQRVRLSDLVISSTDLFFMPQTGFAHTAPDYLYNEGGQYGGNTEMAIITGTAAERADMTIDQKHPSYATTPWNALRDRATTTTSTYQPYFSDPITYQNYISRPAGSKSITTQFGNLPENNPSNKDTRPLLTSLKIWHYHQDARQYNNKVEISADGVTWTTIFDSAVSGRYTETAQGKVHTFPEQKVLFVRDTLNGNTVNTGNHWLEIEAYGYWPSATRVGYGQRTGRPIRLGNHYYMLYTAYISTGIMSGYNTHRIGKFTLAGQQVQVFDYFPHSFDTTESRVTTPQMTTDGVDLIVGSIRPADGLIRFQHFAVSDAGNIVAPYKSVFSTTPHQDPDTYTTVTGLMAGSFDLGAYHYFARHSSGAAWAYDANGNRVVANDWMLGSGYGGNEVAWNGTRFIVGAGMYSSSPLVKTSLSMSKDPIRAAFSWYDDDVEGGTHETDVGPVALSARQARYGVSFSIPVSPPDAGDPDSPNAARLYVKQGSYTNTSDLDRQTLTVVTDPIYGGTTRSASFLDYIPEGEPPSFVNTFPDGIAAKILSQVGGFYVRGDGVGDWPYLRTQIQQGVDASLITVNNRITDLETEVDGRLDVLENAPDPRGVGEVIMFYGTRSQCPAGFLIMDGLTFSSSSYPELAQYLGSTTLPNMTDKYAKQPSATETGGEVSGENSKTLTTANMPSHSHTIDHDHPAATTSSDSHSHTLTRKSGVGGSTGMARGNASGEPDASTSSDSHSHSFNVPAFDGNSGSAGSGTAFDNKPWSMAIWHAIKAVPPAA